MSTYGDIEDMAEVYFGEVVECEFCGAATEDAEHEPNCPLDPNNSFFDEEVAYNEMEDLL